MLLLSLLAGADIGPAALLPALVEGASGATQNVSAIVVFELNLPRALTAVLGGAAFAAAGLMLQESLGNRLAVPELLGVAPGAALAIAVVSTAGLPIPAGLGPGAALAGGLLAGASVLGAATVVRTGQGILLVGAAVSAALSGMLVAVLSAADGFQARALFRYLSGSLADVTWHSASAVGWLVVLLPLTLLTAPALGVLALGPAAASALGVNVGRARAGVLVLAVALVAVVVTVCGPLAWIGLLAPAIARIALPGSRPRPLLGFAMLVGAVLTACADLLARSVFAPIETPLAAWTSGLTVVAAAIATGRRWLRGQR